MVNNAACWGSTCLAQCANFRREEAGVRKQRRGEGIRRNKRGCKGKEGEGEQGRKNVRMGRERDRRKGKERREER